MTEYWNTLTDRERLLMMVMAVLAVLVLGYFALVRPLAGYVASSERTLAAAQATYERVAADAAEVTAARQQGSGEGTRASDVPLRVAVSRAAREAGVSISRIQPGADGGLTVWVEGVPSPQMYRWVQQLIEAHGIAPAKVIAQKSTTEGRLRVQLQFEGTS
jgi:type II secretory pathway component PulM